jgi:TRAP-type C4-dicarboxylate transport system permease large subunit
MITLIAVSFLFLLAMGVPVAFVIGVSGFLGLWWSGQYPLTVVVKQTRERASWAAVGRAFTDALIPLGLPAIIFGGILGGVVTPTEAAVLAVLFFIACGIANVPSDRAPGAMMPYVYMMCAGLLVIILVPWFTLILPRVLGLG